MAKLVSKTYSSALFEVAQESGMMDQILAEYEFVVNSINENPEFYEVLKSPKINNDDKKNIIDKTYAESISADLLHFIKLLIDKKRINSLLKIFDYLVELVNEHKGYVVAKVESVIPLEAKEIKKLQEKLNKVTGKTVTVNNVINPEIVGGLVVKVGDKIIDGSVRRKLDSLKHDLAQIII